MISVPSLCHTTTELSITVGAGRVSPFMLLAVNTTCHMPTIVGAPSSPSKSHMAERIQCAAPTCGFQLDGFTSFVGRPHCATAPGTTAKVSTSATNIDANLQVLVIMSFSSFAGKTAFSTAALSS